ncbi:MAG TPA: RNase adapter RapZ [Sphingobium sp.]|uniref:RNase adapter RapZ n=1 Tax=Sphingobium sp. TaxID=1912891 RepID=UPI002ED27191
MARTTHPKSILIVTGLSGAGKSTSLRTLEDIGWEVVDNFPLHLIDRLLAAPVAEGHDPAEDRPLAIGLDSRTRGFDAPAIIARANALRAEGVTVETLFLDCSGSVLERRFAETRRRHPLALDRPAADGIARERELLEPLRRHADHIVDTTDLNVNALQQEIRARFGQDMAATLTILSFGYARGVPRNADLVFDMRFLRNPHWIPDLKPHTGRDPDVAAYVMGDSCYATVTDQIETLLLTVIPRYIAEGKSYVTVAFGCTGGKHRSVCVAEDMAKRLRKAGFSPTISHRNLESQPLEAYEDRRRGATRGDMTGPEMARGTGAQ